MTVSPMSSREGSAAGRHLGAAPSGTGPYSSQPAGDCRADRSFGQGIPVRAGLVSMNPMARGSRRTTTAARRVTEVSYVGTTACFP